MTDDQSTLLPRITAAVKEAYMDRGPAFTMGGIATRLGISKKTLYAVIPDKEALIELLIDGARSSIKARQAALMADASMGPAARIRAVLETVPEDAASFDYLGLAELETSHPRLFLKIQRLMEEDWEATFALIADAIKAGAVRPFDTAIFRTMYTATLAALFRGRFLRTRGQSYEAALHEVVDIMMKGIET